MLRLVLYIQIGNETETKIRAIWLIPIESDAHSDDRIRRQTKLPTHSLNHIERIAEARPKSCAPVHTIRLDLLLTDLDSYILVVKRVKVVVLRNTIIDIDTSHLHYISSRRRHLPF